MTTLKDTSTHLTL